MCASAALSFLIGAASGAISSSSGRRSRTRLAFSRRTSSFVEDGAQGCVPSGRATQEARVEPPRGTRERGLAPEARPSKALQASPPPAKPHLRSVERDSREAALRFRAPGRPWEAKWRAPRREPAERP